MWVDDTQAEPRKGIVPGSLVGKVRKQIDKHRPFSDLVVDEWVHYREERIALTVQSSWQNDEHNIGQFVHNM